MARYPFEDDGDGHRVIATEKAVGLIEQAWNDFRATFTPIIPSDPGGLASVLAAAVDHCSVEIPTDHPLKAHADGRFVLIEPQGANNQGLPILAGICNKSPRGGWLGGEIEDLLSVPVKRRQSRSQFVRRTSPAARRQRLASCFRHP